jgi:hypothetical protein
MKVKNYKPQELFDMQEAATRDSGPVTCLGLEFENDEARRAHFTEELRKKMQDPEFRKFEGFPIGEDEDILKLSDPPYYTACPNPWIVDFIAEWNALKPAKTEDNLYHKEPFAADVSEGKNDPIYTGHSYHTKVPHKAIMRYILHYTEPGDIVFDGFCGTGMTGVAAQMCDDRDVVMSLGYQVKLDGTILQEETDDDGKKIWKSFSKLGARKAVLNDLSPAATFIAYNYNTPVDVHNFERETKRIQAEVEEECGWMYETLHNDGKTKGNINCILWSDVFICPECGQELVLWDIAIDSNAGKALDVFPCKYCDTELTKKRLNTAWETKYDRYLVDTIKQAKQKPVLIVYTVNGTNGRFQKEPDSNDLEILKKIEDLEIPYIFPVVELPQGYNTEQPKKTHGITHIHHFYTKRNLYSLACFQNKIHQSKFSSVLQYQFDSLLIRQSKRTRLLVSYYFHGGGGWVGTPLSGTLYIPSFSIEVQPFETWSNRYKKTLCRVTENEHFASFTSSMSDTLVPENSQDYIFIDPPFGANINYSELNILWEAWLGVRTNNIPEAIENKIQRKGQNEYRALMKTCFVEAYRILKPGRWMTVEFSNTKASVWNGIQTALTEAGFIVANVSALDKKQGSFKAVTTPTAVKQDLVISVYKPNGGFEDRFEQEAQTEEGIWDFVRTHLKYLPVTKKLGLDIVVIPERDPRILYDQVITYYVRKGFNIPIDSQDFQLGLSQRFSERDGMYFLPEQVAEYDRKKMIGGGRPMQGSLFVQDEATAIEWLRNILRDKPQSFQEINPQFMKEISGWSKNEVGLELSTLLEQNFLSYESKGPVPEQIHSYLSTNWKEMRNLTKDDPALMAKAKNRWYVPDPNKAGDLEKLRERALLKEFEEYKQAKKKLKIFRLEAVRAGFKKAWQEHDHAVIIAVAEKIPSNILEEDPKLLMWYDQAVTRMGVE